MIRPKKGLRRTIIVKFPAAVNPCIRMDLKDNNFWLSGVRIGRNYPFYNKHKEFMNHYRMRMICNAEMNHFEASYHELTFSAALVYFKKDRKIEGDMIFIFRKEFNAPEIKYFGDFSIKLELFLGCNVPSRKGYFA